MKTILTAAALAAVLGIVGTMDYEAQLTQQQLSREYVIWQDPCVGHSLSGCMLPPSPPQALARVGEPEYRP
jgi:hypothetical protein